MEDKKIAKIDLANEIKSLIEQSKRNVALAINAEITALYWHVGNRINSEILQNERAEYGKQIVQSLSAQLVQQYGKGWGEKQLRQCMQFAFVFPDKEIVYALRRQLSWTHILAIIPMEVAIQR
jgi:phosphoribosylformimino-5-aminoimidazole carboxamide ribonucleotide (ProFAR) isomerase